MGKVAEYRRGMEDGIRAFAHWRDGRQEVGTTGKSLSSALENIHKLHTYDPPREPSDVWLLSRLWVDSLENGFHAAQGYKPELVVFSEATADRLISEAGYEIGTGWPISKGRPVPKLKKERIPCA